MGERMEQLLEQLQKTILALRQTQDGAMKLYEKMMPQIIKVMSELMELSNSMPLPEENITEILLQQLKNLENSYGQQDIVVLADTLEYEITDSIRFYMDMINNVE